MDVDRTRRRGYFPVSLSNMSDPWEMCLVFHLHTMILLKPRSPRQLNIHRKFRQRSQQLLHQEPYQATQARSIQLNTVPLRQGRRYHQDSILFLDRLLLQPRTSGREILNSPIQRNLLKFRVQLFHLLAIYLRRSLQVILWRY